MVYVLSHDNLNNLTFAINHFEEGTPNRWRFISEYVSLKNKGEIERTVEVTICGKEKKVEKISTFDEKTCYKIFKIIQCDYLHLLKTSEEYEIFNGVHGNRKDGFKRLVLRAPITKCIFCQCKLSTIATPSFPYVFTENGTYVAANYTSECRNCINKPRYNVSFYTTTENERQTRSYYEDNFQPYYLSTSQSCFSVAYLNYCSKQIQVMGASFESLAEVYNSYNCASDNIRLHQLTSFPRVNLQKTNCILNPHRLEEAWFVYRISSVLRKEIPVCKMDSGLINVEKLCSHVMSSFEEMQQKWVDHACNVKGCKEGYCTIDGNEKLRRSICANGGDKVINDEGLTVQDCCPKDPEFGGKHCKPNKFCTSHKENSNVVLSDEDSEEQRKSERKRKCPLYLQDYITDYGDGNLQKMIKVDHEINSCKDKKKLNKFYSTSAGMFFAIRPCGIIVSCDEMYSHESLTQAFLFLRKVFFKNGVCSDRLKYIGYDRSCELKPFVRRLVQNEVPGAECMLKSVDFLVDIFHVMKHTKSCCMPLHNNPKCEFHPKLEKFVEIHGSNTESCEQAFKRLNRFKHSTRMMTRKKRKLFFIIINNDFNERTEEKSS